MTEAISKLLTSFPHMKVELDEDLKVFGPDFSNRSHSVYRRLFNPYIIKILSANTDTDFLKMIFNFIEELAISGNPDDENLVSVTICERLGDEQHILACAREFMGSSALQRSRDIEIFLGRENA